MQAKTFIEILSNELRKEIRAELEAELASSNSKVVPEPATSHKADQVGLWLSLKMKTVNQSVGQAVNRYGKPAKVNNQQLTVNSNVAESAKVAEPVAVERRGSVTTIEQTFALEFFKREGSKLSEMFSESELKSEFRKIAMRIHPDRHANATSEQLRSYSNRFQALVESAEILEATLK